MLGEIDVDFPAETQPPDESVKSHAFNFNSDWAATTTRQKYVDMMKKSMKDESQSDEDVVKRKVRFPTDLQQHVLSLVSFQ